MLHAIGNLATENNFTAWLSLDENMVCGVGACLTCVIKIKETNGWKWQDVKMVPSLNQRRCFGMSNPNVKINIGSVSMKIR